MTRQQADEYLTNEAIPDRLSRFQSLIPNFDRLNQHNEMLYLIYSITLEKHNILYSRKSPQLQEGLKTMNWDMVVNNIGHGYEVFY